MKRILKRKNKYYVYILQCSDGTLYTGYTNNLEKRIELHNKGRGAKYVRGRGPVKLVYCKEYRYYKNALRAERMIKKVSRKRKEGLIRNGPTQFFREESAQKLNAGAKVFSREVYSK